MDPQGSVHAGTSEDLKELAFLYRCAYPNAADANVAADIKPNELGAWSIYRNEQSEILVAMFIRTDGVLWLLANPEQTESLEMAVGFVALIERARVVLEGYGLRGAQIIYAPTIEPLARRLEDEGLIGPKTALIRTCRFDEHGSRRRKPN
jgi:hypothetical protein